MKPPKRLQRLRICSSKSAGTSQVHTVVEITPKQQCSLTRTMTIIISRQKHQPRAPPSHLPRALPSRLLRRHPHHQPPRPRPRPRQHPHPHHRRRPAQVPFRMMPRSSSPSQRPLQLFGSPSTLVLQKRSATGTTFTNTCTTKSTRSDTAGSAVIYAHAHAFPCRTSRTLDTHHLTRRGAALFRVGAGLSSVSAICFDTFIALRGAGGKDNLRIRLEAMGTYHEWMSLHYTNMPSITTFVSFYISLVTKGSS